MQQQAANDEEEEESESQENGVTPKNKYSKADPNATGFLSIT